jgi:tetratricopeptide (TPR) repeat protein
VRRVRAILVAAFLTLAALLAAPERGAAQARTVERGFELLEAGRASEAEAHFEAILRDDPRSLGAAEGLVWARLRLGDLERAAQAADLRLGLEPGDAQWQSKRLGVLAQVRSRREEAVAGYRDLLRVRPRDLALHLELARVLSWMPQRLGEAVEAYRVAVALEPGSREARLGLGRTLSWTGQLGEAATVLDSLLEEGSPDAEALATRAQVALWSGDRGRALLCARQALGLDGESAAAREVLDDVEALLAPRTGVRATYSSESTPFRRFVVAAPLVEFHLRAETRVRFEAAYSWFRDGEDVIERRTVGGSLRQELPLESYVDLLYRHHAPEDVAATHQFDVEVGGRQLWRALTLRAGVRRRAIVDEGKVYEDVAYLQSVGSGGTTLQGIRDRLQVLEGHGGLALAPAPFLYAYADGARGRVNERPRNDRSAVAAGLGVNVLRLADVLPDHDLTVKYDFFYLSYARGSPAYFSPDGFRVHAPGIEYRVRFLPRSVLGVEAGLPLRSGARPGYTAGTYFRLALSDRLHVEARGRITDDTEFRIKSATAGVSFRF